MFLIHGDVVGDDGDDGDYGFDDDDGDDDDDDDDDVGYEEAFSGGGYQVE